MQLSGETKQPKTFAYETVVSNTSDVPKVKFGSLIEIELLEN